MCTEAVGNSGRGGIDGEHFEVPSLVELVLSSADAGERISANLQGRSIRPFQAAPSTGTYRCSNSVIFSFWYCIKLSFCNSYLIRTVISCV